MYAATIRKRGYGRGLYWTGAAHASPKPIGPRIESQLTPLYQVSESSQERK